MSTSIEIYSKVNNYIEHRMTLRDLESWLVYMLPTYLLNPSSSAAQLAGTIELGLAEIRAGIRTERSLKRLLMKYAGHNPISSEPYPYDPTMNETISSVSSIETRDLEWPGQSPSWSSAPQVVYV